MSDTIEELSKLDKSELIKKILEQNNQFESLKKEYESLTKKNESLKKEYESSEKTKEVLKKQIMFRLLIKMFMKILINNKKIKNLI